MSNNAMSNETDLDWFARNVHVWPGGDGITLLGRGCSFFDTGVGRSVHVYAVDGSDYTTIKEKDWLTRRAELQNKPSWNDAPEWANCIVQDKIGNWFFCSDTPNHNGREWDDEYVRKSLIANGGVVLGDWRDTLENRPEEFKPSIEDANRLAQDFKPFTSIEDNQEQGMKQDNGWFERGELPPVGFECEMKRIDGRWCKAVTVGKDSGGRMVCELNDNGVFYASTSIAASFRPIRTDRGELIRLIKTFRHTLRSDGEVADAILEAGFRLGVK